MAAGHRFAFIQLLLLLPVLGLEQDLKHTLPGTAALWLLVVGTLALHGFLLDGKRWALAGEALRVVLVGTACWWVRRSAPAFAPYAAHIAATLVVSIAFLLARVVWPDAPRKAAKTA
jgi:hypothetical protein